MKQQKVVNAHKVRRVLWRMKSEDEEPRLALLHAIEALEALLEEPIVLRPIKKVRRNRG